MFNTYRPCAAMLRLRVVVKTHFPKRAARLNTTTYISTGAKIMGLEVRCTGKGSIPLGVAMDTQAQ